RVRRRLVTNPCRRHDGVRFLGRPHEMVARPRAHAGPKSRSMTSVRSHRWIEHLRAPALRAYGGLRVRDQGATPTADVLGPLGTLEVRLARPPPRPRRGPRRRLHACVPETA